MCDCAVESHEEAEKTELASSVLDILSLCLVRTNSWLTLPASMRLTRLVISHFLDMYVIFDVRRCLQLKFDHSAL